MKSTRHLVALNAAISNQVRKGASPGERVIASVFPSRGSGYPGYWYADRVAQVQHYRNWQYIAIDLIARKKASVTANLCYRTDRPIRGATVKACQRSLMNLIGDGLGADPYVGQRVTLKSAAGDPKTTTVYGNYVGLDGYDPRAPVVGFGGGGHSWLTIGEWRCLSEDTECLTDNGWKKYNELTEQTRIACYNDKSDKIEYHCPSAVHIYDYDGDMLCWQHKSVDIAVTPNHTMPVWVQSASYYKLGKQYDTETEYGAGKGLRLLKEQASSTADRAIFRVQVSAAVDAPIPDLIEIAPGKSISARLWAEFIGWYVSEGFCEAGQSRFGLCQKRWTEKSESINWLLSQFPDWFDWRKGVAGAKTCDQWRSSDPDVYDHIRKHLGVGAGDKRLPAYVKAWPSHLLKMVLKSAISGDGSVRLEGNKHGTGYFYNSISKRLIEDIQEVAVKCGYRTSSVWHFPPRSGRYGTRDIYRISVSTTTNKAEIRKKHLSVVPYQGKVWCVTVPTGMFVVRRNEKVHITGNSKALSVVKPHDNLMPLEHDHPYRRLCENPNPIDTPYDLAYERRMFKGLCGVAYEWTPKNRYGQPCERWIIPSHWVWPRTGGGSEYLPYFKEHADELVWDYEIRPWGYPGYAGLLHFPPDEVVVYRDKNPLSKIDGWSKLSAGAQVIDLEETITQRQWSQLIQLGVPGMVVKSPPGYEDWDDNDIARVEAKLFQRIQGAFNHGGMMMVPSGAEVEPWGYNPTEMAFQAAEDQARDRVCAFHGVPKAAFGQGNDMTYGSVMGLLGTIHSMVINPELVSDGQTETKQLASQFSERAPAFSTMSGGGHGAAASMREVVCFYDDTVPADPQQVNSDLQLDLQCNAITPNEVRALRGRQPFKRGGDNPIVNGPGGPMPLEINAEERHIDDMVEILAKITSAEGKQTGEQQTQSDQAADESRVEATEDQPLADDHGGTGLEPPEKPNGKPSKMYVTEAEGDRYEVHPVKVRDRTAWQVTVNGKVTDTFDSQREAETQVEWYKQRDREDPTWNRKALDRLGGEESNIDPAQLRAADFITMSAKIPGTSCTTCEFNVKGVCGFVGEINGKHVDIRGQRVNARNCCGAYDNPELLRTWREEKSLDGKWIHPSLRKQIGGESLVRSFPDVRQDNHWRCGAACFAAVCQHFGVEMTVDEASKVLGTNVQRSTDPAAIIRELRKRGIAVQPRRGMTVEQLRELTDAGRPVIVCLQDYGDRREDGASFAYGHYMVALGASHGVLIFQDPSIENVEREPGGDVPRSEADASGNVAMPGRVVLDAEKFDAAWHDQRANGEKLVRFGIVCGPRQRMGIVKVIKCGGEGGTPGPCPENKPQPSQVGEGKQAKDWVTLEPSGTHVFIDGAGNVTAGPANLSGRPANHMSPKKPEGGTVVAEKPSKPAVDAVKPGKRHLNAKQLKAAAPNYEKIKDAKLRKKVEAGVREYYNGEFQAMNGTLRQGKHVGGMFNSSPERVKELVAGMQDAFEHVGHALEADTIVYRRTDKDLPFDYRTPGVVFQDNGFVSTSAEEGITKRATLASQVMYKIRVPKGTKVIVGKGGEDTAKEVTLNSGTKFRVVSSKNNGRLVELEVFQ